MNKTNKYKKIPSNVSFHLRYLHQDMKLTLAELMRIYPQYSKTSIFRHSKLPFGELKPDGRQNNKGRTVKLTDRDNRKLVCSLLKLRENYGNFTSTDVQRESGILEKNVSNRTIRRCLRKHGYSYMQCRRKGQLLKEDLKARLTFARKCKNLPETFWRQGVSFYFDGTGWAHKTNPCRNARTSRTRTWKKKSEGLDRLCTAKGKKEGSGGKMAKFMVAISYNRGIIKCSQYTGNVNSEFCASFIQEHFPDMFENSANVKGKLFLQDGDPSQNSKLARDAMDLVGCKLFKIPPRSPDLNPIENIFHLIGKKLKTDALTNDLQHESYSEFCKRVQKISLDFPIGVIDKTIDSMSKRIDIVIKNKGLRTKY